MLWIDITVALLLTLRMTLFGPALPPLLDPNSDAWVPEGKKEQQEHPIVGDGEMKEYSPRKP